MHEDSLTHSDDTMIPFSDSIYTDDMHDTLDSYVYEGDELYPFNEQDQWGWDGHLTPVPGFGFLPKRVNDELDHMTQDVANMTDLDMSNFSVATMDHFKCTILNETWTIFFPHLKDKPPEVLCPPLWDAASCIPPTLAGYTAVFPCMTMYNNKYYDTTNNATRSCLSTGHWDNLTDYSTCNELCIEEDNWNQTTKYIDCALLDGDQSTAELEISLHVYFIGYTISLIALLGAVFIFLSFREMRCLRHKIHIGLFLTLIMSDMSWIFTAFIQSLIQTEYYKVVIQIWCASQIVLRYFHLTTFFWMFLEGLYLFLQVQLPLTLASIKHLHFVVIGWGCPLLNMIIWCVLRIHNSENGSARHLQDEGLDSRESKVMSLVLACPFLEESSTDFYAYKMPVFILLIANSFFLVWIMVIVVSKLRARTAMDHDRRHYKAAKALVVVIPLFGFTYLLTLMGPSKESNPLAYTIFQSVRAVLLSTQGAVITLPYCYLNSEVQGVIKCHWERWKMVRNVEFECQSTRTSLAHSSIYYAQDSGNSSKLKILTQKLDSEMLLVPGSKSQTCSKSSSRENSYSEMSQPFSDAKFL